MSKRKSELLVRKLVQDINLTINELRQNGLIRDEAGISEKKFGSDLFEISFSNKSSANSIMLDKHVSASRIMDALLLARQYTILLYDKGIIQAEFCISNGEIAKERLVFLKKHNRIWTKEEIIDADEEDEDWFADEESVPLFIRVDYDPSNHIECEHAISHLTLSNHESCRIPLQDALSFSEFIGFILLHFYGYKLSIAPYRMEKPCSISELERKMIHLGWDS